MFNKRTPTKLGLIIASLMAFTSLTVIAATTSKGIGTRSLTMAEAQKMAEQVKDTDLPIVVNDLVLEELNRYIGTAQGRAFMRDALIRMKDHQPMVQEKLSAFELPAELAAIPLVESGYQNLPPRKNPVGSAGLWQFIAESAKNYGLTVTDKVDERLDEEKETVAALKYLSANKANFKHWELAILAFNWGEKRVAQSMQKLNSKDAWDLIRENDVNDQGYLAKVMAAVLIMKNPSSVE